jgi:transcription initiation factor TFIIIB Brf1 subunit/transcription initiation factor TFIIB
LRQLNHTDILNHTSKIWEEQEPTAHAIASETARIINEAIEKAPSFFWGKSRKWILGGLFYLLGRRIGVAKTQKQIARCLDTDEMTIRDSYREWLGHFPEFWFETTARPKESHSKRSKPSSNPNSKKMAKFL